VRCRSRGRGFIGELCSKAKFLNFRGKLYLQQQQRRKYTITLLMRGGKSLRIAGVGPDISACLTGGQSPEKGEILKEEENFSICLKGRREVLRKFFTEIGAISSINL